nr:MAG TPA: hypothetical protein [Caudoviricetes sp.]
MYGEPYYNPYPMGGMGRQYPPQPQNQPQTNIIFVNGLEDVKSRLQACKSQMLYCDNDKNIVYFKNVDETGHFTVNIFDLVEHKKEKAPEVNYITREEFEEFKKSLTPKTEEGASV